MDKTYFILGCTACGKGAVGRALAVRLGGAVLSVDSMKIYRRMDIGTAKPSAEACAAVPHYGLDLVEPWEGFSVADYAEYAENAIAEIRGGGRIPIGVGGTNLYIQALTQGLFEGPAADAELRSELQARAASEGLATLHAELAAVDAEAAGRIHPNDEKRIIRALEVYRKTGRPISELQTQWDTARREDVVLIGLRRKKENQSRRINARVKKMVEMGLGDEFEKLMAMGRPLSKQAAMAVGYAELFPWHAGECTFEQAVEKIKINTRRLAKKQRTWQRRWPDIKWFDLADDEPVEQTVERIMDDITFE